VQDISCIALSQDVNLLYCHCVATTDARELRSVQMVCYMYHIIMTTVGAHTYVYWYDTICLSVRIKYNNCIRLIKNSVEVDLKSSCQGSLMIVIFLTLRVTIYFVSEWLTHVSHKLGLSWIFFLHESVSSERNFNKFRWNIEVVQLTFSHYWYRQLL